MNLFKDLAIALKPETTSTQKASYYSIPLDGVVFDVSFTYEGSNRLGEPLFFEPAGIDNGFFSWDENLTKIAQDTLYKKAYDMLKAELVENRF